MRWGNCYAKVELLQSTTDHLPWTSEETRGHDAFLLFEHYSAIPVANRTADDKQSLAQLLSPRGEQLIGTPRMLVQWTMILSAHYRAQLREHQQQIDQYEAQEIARLRDATRGEYARRLRGVARDVLRLDRDLVSTLSAKERNMAIYYGLLPLAALAVSYAGIRVGSRKRREDEHLTKLKEFLGSDNQIAKQIREGTRKLLSEKYAKETSGVGPVYRTSLPDFAAISQELKTYVASKLDKKKELAAAEALLGESHTSTLIRVALDPEVFGAKESKAALRELRRICIKNPELVEEVKLMAGSPELEHIAALPKEAKG